MVASGGAPLAICASNMSGLANPLTAIDTRVVSFLHRALLIMLQLRITAMQVHRYSL